MASLKNLTGGQLEKMLNSTREEIKRRESIQIATAEIQALLNKHKISIQDIDLQALNKKIKGKSPSKGPKKGKIVKPKYANPQGVDRWSGRGRAPSWVMELCTKEGIDLADFKKDPRFTAN